MLKKMALYTALGLALLACLSPAPASAGEPTVAAAPPAAEAGASGCDRGLDLVSLSQAVTGPAMTPSQPAPEPMAPPFLRRTCRCSCGFPCTTNADCGPGGLCSAGITCC